MILTLQITRHCCGVQRQGSALSNIQAMWVQVSIYFNQLWSELISYLDLFLKSCMINPALESSVIFVVRGLVVYLEMMINCIFCLCGFNKGKKPHSLNSVEIRLFNVYKPNIGIFCIYLKIFWRFLSTLEFASVLVVSALRYCSSFMPFQLSPSGYQCPD